MIKVSQLAIPTMVLILESNPVDDAHAWSRCFQRKKIRFVVALDLNQMPSTDQITEIAPYVRS